MCKTTTTNAIGEVLRYLKLKWGSCNRLPTSNSIFQWWFEGTIEDQSTCIHIQTAEYRVGTHGLLTTFIAKIR